MKQTLSTHDIAASQHFLHVETPNADLPAGCARAGSAFHPSCCLKLEVAPPVQGRRIAKGFTASKEYLRETLKILVTALSKNVKCIR